ncbi:putative ergosterol biosynthetic protein 28 [Lamellibrachia satsuma]|nr:putative ergosterol biosynthetic protein 28 [Lamellibrachia satsuma]
MAFGNTISCFYGHQFLADKLYTAAPNEVNGLAARLFGVWTMLSAVLRLCCAVDIHNKSIYNLTLVSFFLAFIHFVLEIYVYKTATLSVGVLAPLLVSGVSIVWMLTGYYYLNKPTEMESEDKMGMLKKKKKKSQ